MSDDIDLLILLAHGVSASGFAEHAFHLASAGVALGKTVSVYLAVEGTTCLSATAPPGIAEQLAQLRELGVGVYACPRSLAEHGIQPSGDAYTPLGATAAVRLATRAATIISL